VLGRNNKESAKSLYLQIGEQKGSSSKRKTICYFSVTLKTKNPLISSNKRVFKLYCVNRRIELSNHLHRDLAVVGEYLKIEE
jgi:hypothetical protein